MKGIKIIKKLVNSSFNLLGYRISTAKLPKDMDRGFVHLYERCKSYTLTSKERMFALYKAVQYVVDSGKKGALVECGVWKGGSAMLMAYSLKAKGDAGRDLYLYDTFTGMTKPTEKDRFAYNNSSTLKIWHSQNKKDHNDWAYAPFKEVRKNMKSTRYPPDKIKYVKGKVEDTLPKTAPSKISLLRLDTDWYESTYHELKYLYPRLVKGGVLIIDDYGFFKGAREPVEQYFSEKNISILLNRIDHSGRIAVKA
ncbi:macrocin O-methyltransferase [Candidatus Woesearchaeota archaeon]|nr:macrocin O-methyltransferase [Candidatus Woesearchaeota archaeon]